MHQSQHQNVEGERASSVTQWGKTVFSANGAVTNGKPQATE